MSAGSWEDALRLSKTPRTDLFLSGLNAPMISPQHAEILEILVPGSIQLRMKPLLRLMLLFAHLHLHDFAGDFPPLTRCTCLQALELFPPLPWAGQNLPPWIESPHCVFCKNTCDVTTVRVYIDQNSYYRFAHRFLGRECVTILCFLPTFNVYQCACCIGHIYQMHVLIARKIQTCRARAWTWGFQLALAGLALHSMDCVDLRIHQSPKSC